MCIGPHSENVEKVLDNAAAGARLLVHLLRAVRQRLVKARRAPAAREGPNSQPMFIIRHPRHRTHSKLTVEKVVHMW